MGETRTQRVELILEYVGTNPRPGAFGEYPLEPRWTDELVVAVRDHPDLVGDVDPPVFPTNPTQFQVHLAGTGRALEELGRYLIALARSPTADPEPYGSFDDARNADGGSIRLLARRLREPQDPSPWSEGYKDGVCAP